MKNIFICLLCLLNVSTLFAQNNPIFVGGNADGFDKINFAQASNNIFTGGNADGWSKTTFAQTENNIFTGGGGNGWDKTSFAQPVNNIFNGGNGDGWEKTSFAQAVNNIFNGGDGDGWEKTSFAQALNNIFNGGNGDGWDKTSFEQPSNNIFFGGLGDGWASTYRPMGPLPVTLEYFTARKNNTTSSLLHWKTIQEINTAYFDIERSSDAIGFKKIGKVNAGGNSTTAIEYNFIDNNPEQGINYYRLRQVDIDGSFMYTPARQVIFDKLQAGSVKYYPNPTNGILTIELSAVNSNEVRVVNICNSAGLVVNQFKISAFAGTKMQIDLSKYAKGTYFIQVKTAIINSTERIVLQ
jgi:Secretion system C-terminal sorting domain